MFGVLVRSFRVLQGPRPAVLLLTSWRKVGQQSRAFDAPRFQEAWGPMQEGAKSRKQGMGRGLGIAVLHGFVLARRSAEKCVVRWPLVSHTL